MPKCYNTINYQLIKNYEMGLTAAAIFIDLTKAFDTLDHEMLLKNWHSMA